MSEPPRKYDKGNIIQDRYGGLLRVNNYYYSAMSDGWRYFGSYISRYDGKVIAHNDKTVGSAESSYPTKVADSLKEWKHKNLPTASERMERL